MKKGSEGQTFSTLTYSIVLSPHHPGPTKQTGRGFLEENSSKNFATRLGSSEVLVLVCAGIVVIVALIPDVKDLE